MRNFLNVISRTLLPFVMVLLAPLPIFAQDTKQGADFILIQAGRLLAIPGQAPNNDQTIVISAGHIVEIHDGFIGEDALELREEETSA